MVRERPVTPRGHGEVLTDPAFAEWAALAAETAEQAASWPFEVLGVPAPVLRRQARRETLDAARRFSARLGVPVDDPPDEPALIALTGHQPELYHCGVWIKDFLLQRFAEQTGAAAIDLVVDSDGFDALDVVTPCRRPDVARCRAYLAIGGRESCYACTPAPRPEDVRQFADAVRAALGTLHAPAVARHFDSFIAALESALPDAADVAELVTFARRRFEAAAGTTYLELPATAKAGTDAFLTFMAGLALDAPRFADVHDHELAAFRKRAGLRSAAQPFPDLRREDGLVETLFWRLRGRGRESVFVRPGERVEVVAGGETLAVLPTDREGAVAALRESGARFAPKAVALTMYGRLFVADLFIHGVGGGRYDRFTDALISRWYGIRPPRFAVASMTMYLPLGAHVVTEEDVDRERQRLNRLRHNPDQLLHEVEFEERGEAARAHALSDEKRRLVEAITAPGADKKALGGRIREVNDELSALLEPLAADMERRIEELQRQKESADILTDRTYPFCFWSPEEVRDKAW